MYYVIDESSFRIDKTSFPSAEEAEQRAREAARIVGRAINVYALDAGELNFAFRVMPDGTVENENPLTDPQPGDQIAPAAPVALGQLEVLDLVADVLEEAGRVDLSAAVDQQTAKLANKPRGNDAIEAKILQAETLVTAAEFVVYYETDKPKKSHKKKVPSLKAGKEMAKKISLEPGRAYISVMRNGIDVAVFYKGKEQEP